jgi:hypothetical protein
VRALTPWLGEDSAARGDYLIHDGAVHVSAVDVQLDQPQPLTLDVIADRESAFFLGSVCRSHGAGNDRRPWRGRWVSATLTINTSSRCRMRSAPASPPPITLRSARAQSPPLHASPSLPTAASPTMSSRLATNGNIPREPPPRSDLHSPAVPSRSPNGSRSSSGATMRTKCSSTASPRRSNAAWTVCADLAAALGLPREPRKDRSREESSRNSAAAPQLA